MDVKDNTFKIIAVSVLIVAVLIVSIAYAGFTSNLTINGTASLSPSWKIIWTNLSSGTVSGYASVDGSTLAIDSSNQGISGEIGTLSAPGDTISYTWRVKNDGEVNAVLSSITKGTVSCAPSATNGATTEEVNTVCPKIAVTYTYNGTTIPDSGISGLSTSLTTGSYVTVGMTLSYNSDTSTQLSGNVAISISTTTFTYVQA